MEVIITEQPEMDSVVTMVELDTQQIKYLIDLMWSTDPTLGNSIAVRHNVDDIHLEKHLTKELGRALDELDAPASGYNGLRLDEIQEWDFLKSQGTQEHLRMVDG